ncbi:MAG: hypothetical protein VX153_00680 [Verrucomicrobiota bacterium]|nr:hypothetical protein [Verrucomicrobiota bacterium]
MNSNFFLRPTAGNIKQLLALKFAYLLGHGDQFSDLFRRKCEEQLAKDFVYHELLMDSF